MSKPRQRDNQASVRSTTQRPDRIEELQGFPSFEGMTLVCREHDGTPVDDVNAIGLALTYRYKRHKKCKLRAKC